MPDSATHAAKIYLRPHGGLRGPERQEDRFGYELHLLVADLLPERSDEIRPVGVRNLARMMERHGSSRRQLWLDEWDRLLHAKDDGLAVGMLRLGELGNDMKSITPVAGALTQAERLQALHRAQTARGL
jgi:hypothetical protein